MKSYSLVILFTAISVLLNSDMALAKNEPSKKTEQKTKSKSDKKIVSKQDGQNTAAAVPNEILSHVGRSFSVHVKIFVRINSVRRKPAWN